MVPQPREDVPRAGAIEQFGRVRRDGTGREQGEPVEARHGSSDLLQRSARRAGRWSGPPARPARRTPRSGAGAGRTRRAPPARPPARRRPPGWPGWTSCPRLAPGLVTTMLRSCRSCRANCSEVRSDRYDSAAGEVGSASVTSSGFCRRQEATSGVMASTGAPPACSTASLEVSRSSRLSRRKAAPRPSASPAARPSRASWAGLGELGERGLRGRDQHHVAGIGRAADLHLGQLLLQHRLLVEQRRRLRRGRVAPEGLELLC